MKTAKEIIVLAGAGQIGMAIAGRMGQGTKIFVADWKLENANARSRFSDGWRCNRILFYGPLQPSKP